MEENELLKRRAKALGINLSPALALDPDQLRSAIKAAEARTAAKLAPPKPAKAPAPPAGLMERIADRLSSEVRGAAERGFGSKDKRAKILVEKKRREMAAKLRGER